MATTSFLYHSMRIRGYRYLRCEYLRGVIYHHVRLRRDRRRCRGCGARWHEVSLEGQFKREFVTPADSAPRSPAVMPTMWSEAS